MSGVPKDGIVMDIFSGIGTVAKNAYLLKKNYICFELSKKYHQISQNTIKKYCTKNNLDKFIKKNRTKITDYSN